jgi:hypothetical protein
MRRRRNEIEERRVERLLARLWRRIPAPPERALRDIARSAAAVERPPQTGEAPRGTLRFARTTLRRRLTWGVAVGAALLAGSGLGFGLGSSVTSEAAGTNLVGLGFLPARGWMVVQSGTIGATGAASAIAANVPIHPDDGVGEPPHATLRSLPRGGVLVFARFTTRGDPGEDVKFPVRELPLQVSGASPVSPHARGLAQYRLRAATGGYNVDVRIYFGDAPPRASMVDAAQRQLNRLVVAAERVTIFARPTVASGTSPVTLFGSVDNGAAGEVVDIQAKDCGQQFFRGVLGATTHDGGGWSTPYYPGITTTLRAVWNGNASGQITVRQRPRVELRPPLGGLGQFEVSVVAKAQFWRKRVLIQRFNRRLGTWTTVKSVVLTDTDAAGGSQFVWSSAEFTSSLPRRTLIRAVFPLSQARPCYLAGYSNLLRT